jgi:hypothetical protein
MAARAFVDVDPNATPWLEWQWRTRMVDARATVAVFDLDDAPARVAVGFRGDLSMLPLREQAFGDLVYAITGYLMPFATLMYVWDGQAPVGSVFWYARSSRIRYLVVESGPEGADRWLAYRRNVVEDYRLVFGAEPGGISDLGVLTDSDDLRTLSDLVRRPVVPRAQIDSSSHPAATPIASSAAYANVSLAALAVIGSSVGSSSWVMS